MKITVFIKNTAVLIITALILRSIGIIFKIFLANKIGSEGMGLYQLIFSVFVLFSAFATSGISTAVTRLVCEAKGKSEISSILRKASILTLILSLISGVVLFFGAKYIANFIIGDERCILPLKILIFSLPFIGLSSCIRGYFLALQKTIEPSIIVLLEQIVRISVILILLNKLSGQNVSVMIFAVMVGNTLAEAVSFLVSFIVYKINIGNNKNKNKKSGAYVYKKIINIALPITASSYLSSFLHTAENILVPLRLSLFYGTKQRGLELFGAIRSMALPVIFFPASFLTSFSTMLIPEISSASALGKTLKIKNTVNKAVGITLALSVFVACVFWFCAYDISFLLYNDKDVGFIIKILSPIIPFMYLESVSAGVLKGLDRQVNMFWYNLCDSAVRIATVYIFLPIFGIKGYLAVMIVSNCFTSSLALNCLLKTSGVMLNLPFWIIKPLITGVLGGILSTALCENFENLMFKTVAMIVIQAAVFLLFFTKNKRHYV